MTAEEVKNKINTLILDDTTGNTTLAGYDTPTVTAYGIWPFEPYVPGKIDVYPNPTVGTNDSTWTILENKKPVPTLQEIRALLLRTYEFLSDMGEYPPELDSIIGEDIQALVGEREEEHDLVPEMVLVRVLRWVLGE